LLTLFCPHYSAHLTVGRVRLSTVSNIRTNRYAITVSNFYSNTQPKQWHLPHRAACTDHSHSFPIDAVDNSDGLGNNRCVSPPIYDPYIFEGCVGNPAAQFSGDFSTATVSLSLSLEVRKGTWKDSAATVLQLDRARVYQSTLEHVQW
jgi:hypothetical protein